MLLMQICIIPFMPATARYGHIPYKRGKMTSLNTLFIARVKMNMHVPYLNWESGGRMTILSEVSSITPVHMGKAENL